MRISSPFLAFTIGIAMTLLAVLIVRPLLEAEPRPAVRPVKVVEVGGERSDHKRKGKRENDGKGRRKKPERHTRHVAGAGDGAPATSFAPPPPPSPAPAASFAPPPAPAPAPAPAPSTPPAGDDPGKDDRGADGPDD
jgi:hypothetical protein